MKTSKEFIERLQSDEEFAKEVAEKVREKAEAGATDYKEIWIPIAAEYGYEITGEELDELNDKALNELSVDELGKVAGGTSPGIPILVSLLGSSAVLVTATIVTEKTKND